MSLRRNGLFVVPVMLGCWTLKPADEVPDGGADVARSDVGADVASRDDVSDASQQDLAFMDAVRVDGGMDAGPSDVPMDAVRFDVRMDVLPIDVPMDAARFDVRMDVAPVDAPDVIVPVDVPVTIPTGLRLIGPPSLSTVSDQSPTLIWSAAVSLAQLRVCPNRACTTVAYTSMVSGTQHEVAASLSEGVYFWNLRRLDTGAVLTTTWQFRVPNLRRRRPGPPLGVTHRDTNNDGLVDLALGAPGPQGTRSAGRVQVHFGGLPVMPSPNLSADGPTGTSGFGYGWRLAWGDFNRDNRADLAVGIFDPVENRQGRIEVLRSDPTGGFTASPIVGANLSPTSLFVTSMSSGDLNGDGFDDLAASAVGGVGQLQVHLGSSTGLRAMPVVIPGPLGRPSVFGASTVVLGDIDGDGFGDLLVGDTCDPGQTMLDMPRCQPTSAGQPGPSGRMYLFFGQENWTAVDVTHVRIEGASSGRLGRAAAPAGDLNGDGYADFVVSGTTGTDEDSTGVVHVYLGRPRAQWMQTVMPHRSLNGDSSNAMLGASVAALDVNHDGRTDILAGAPGRAASMANYPGSVLVWLANTSGGYDPALALRPIGASGALFGENIASVGDVNGDGWGDLEVAAPLNPARSLARGEVYLWTEVLNPFPSPPPSVSIQGATNNVWLGRGIAH